MYQELKEARDATQTKMWLSKRKQIHEMFQVMPPLPWRAQDHIRRGPLMCRVLLQEQARAVNSNEVEEHSQARSRKSASRVECSRHPNDHSATHETQLKQVKLGGPCSSGIL
jgi:hypothetical protein